MIQLLVSAPPYGVFEPSTSSPQALNGLPDAALVALAPEPTTESEALAQAITEATLDAPHATVGMWIAHNAAIRHATAANRAGACFVASGLDGPDLGDIRAQLLDPKNIPDAVLRWLARARPECNGVRRVALAVVRGALLDYQASALAQSAGVSSRTLRRTLRGEHLPPFRAWSNLARALNTVVQLQANPKATVAATAFQIGHHDATTLRRQLAITFDVTPTKVRGTLGIHWLLSRWLDRVMSD